MSPLRRNSAGKLILLSLALGFVASGNMLGMAQSDATTALDQQVKSDTDELSTEQQTLSNYQEQAKFYDQFAKKRLDHASTLRKDVEKRLRNLEQAKANDKKASKDLFATEIQHLKTWLADDSAKTKQIEAMRERWRTAIENQTNKIQNTKYQTDVDKASLDHQKTIDKANAQIAADNPPPPKPQVQQTNVLIPGWEEEQANIPVLLGPGHN